MQSRSAILVPVVLAATIALTACAGGATPGDQPPPAVDVVGQGTVLQVDDAAPQLCLGAVDRSSPSPSQCSGVELAGWDWDAVDSEERANGVTSGTYAVRGAWDGLRLTVTGSIMLALYDATLSVDPLLDPANAGSSTESDLMTIQGTLTADSPVPVLTSSVENGYVFARVTYDDGSIQRWADERFGPDVVLIRPALVRVETPRG